LSAPLLDFGKHIHFYMDCHDLRRQQRYAPGYAVDAQRHVLTGDTLNNVSGQRVDYSTPLRLESGWQFRLGLGAEHGAGYRHAAWSKATARISF